MEFIKNYRNKLEKNLKNVEINKIDEICNLLLDAYCNNKNIFVIGNGGSAASASHFVCDLGKGTVLDKDSNMKRFNTISLVDNVPLMTAYGNDLGYEYIFSEQLKNLANEKDILISISASGNSPNIIKAIEVAKEKKMINIGLSGFSGGKLKEMSDYGIHITDNHYGRVEDLHMMILHMIAYKIKEKINI